MTTCGSVDVLVNNVGLYDEIGLAGNLNVKIHNIFNNIIVITFG